MNKKLQAITIKRSDGKLEAIASDETPDRVGDVIKVADWDFRNFVKNPVLQAGHDYKPQFTIGVATDLRVEGNKVKFTPKFHNITQLAREIAQMYQEGFLKAWSVGFIPADKEAGRMKHELLEVSAVAVPANPSALTEIKGLESEAEGYDAETVGKVVEWVGKNFDPSEEAGKVSVETSETKEAEVPAEEKVENKNQDMIEEHFSMMENEITASIETHKGEMIDMLYGDPDKQNEGYKKPKKKPGMKEMGEPVERWNASLSKAFDVESVNVQPANFEFDLYKKFLDCRVRDIFMQWFTIPSPLLGSYLSAFKEVTSGFDLKDTRNFTWNGAEAPLTYEVIQLNSERSEDFMISGTKFYQVDGKNQLIMKFQPDWFGLNVMLVTTNDNKEFNKNVLVNAEKWVLENNLLKGEKFALNGEFLKKSEDSWENTLLSKEVESPVHKALELLKNQGTELKSRGLLFMGPPGTGKTKTGRVIMNSLEKTTFIWVSTRDFLMAGSTQTVKLAFKMARDLAPTVLFMEDIDTWLSGSTIDLMKTEMDGLKKNVGVVTILTSNYPEKLPEALIDRPGRFHDVLDFALPDSELRKKMLSLWAGNEVEVKTIDTVIEQTEGFSGAHMYELVEYAKMIASDEKILIGDALIKSLQKLTEQRQLIKRIHEGKKSFDPSEIEVKEGRILSQKNRTTIQETVSKLNETTIALEKLLEMSEPPAKGEKGNEVERSTPKVAQKPEASNKLDGEKVIVRALQQIAKNSNFALNKLKK